LLRAMTLGRGLEHVRDDAAHAFLGLAEGSPYRAIARYVEGAARALLDEPSARELLEEGARIGSVLLPHAQAWCLGELARLAAAAGDWREAEILVDHGLWVVREFGLEDHPATSVVYATAAAVHAVRGATEHARVECHRGIELIQRIENFSSYPLVSAYLELTTASTLVGELDAAVRLLDESERRVRRLPDARALPGRLEQVRRIFEDATAPSETLAVSLSPAELRVLQWLPTHLSFGEIGDELFVSRNTVKSHVMAIYRKLGVTSRGSAVAAARALGLVGDEQLRP